LQETEESTEGNDMAERKPFLGNIKVDHDLQELLERSKHKPVTESDLQEQRISFAYGNAPANAKSITKDSVRKTSQNILLKS
jgi:hypothetical protein